MFVLLVWHMKKSEVASLTSRLKRKKRTPGSSLGFLWSLLGEGTHHKQLECFLLIKVTGVTNLLEQRSQMSRKSWSIKILIFIPMMFSGCYFHVLLFVLCLQIEKKKLLCNAQKCAIWVGLSSPILSNWSIEVNSCSRIQQTLHLHSHL